MPEIIMSRRTNALGSSSLRAQTPSEHKLPPSTNSLFDCVLACGSCRGNPPLRLLVSAPQIICSTRSSKWQSPCSMARTSSIISIFFLLLFVAMSAMDASSAEECVNRVAIVTGGTRGIGRGITEALAESGNYSHFILSYNTNRDAAESFVADLKQRHLMVKVELIGGDISLPETRNAIFKTLDKRLNHCTLCVMVHNAGQYVGITSDNVDGLEASEEYLSFGDGSLLKEDGTTNFDQMHYYQRMYGEAWVDLCERALARMRKAAAQNEGFRGSLIGISSPGCNLMQRPIPSYSMPGSGKSLMEYSMRIFALKAAPFGINVNVVIPGVTKTEAWSNLEKKRGMEPGELVTKVTAMTPMQSSIAPKEIGEVVNFLCSSAGGRFLTGISLPADGGLHLK